MKKVISSAKRSHIRLDERMAERWDAEDTADAAGVA